MKISTAVTFLIIISAVFAIFGLMVHEANQQYTGTDGYTAINSSAWGNQADSGNTGPYDFVDKINGTLGPLESKWKQIQDPEQGFFSKITAGLTAIPYAIMLLPDVLFSSISMAGAVITGFMTVLNIPVWFITAGLVLVLIWAIFKLLEFFQRVPI
jgi:hypothetical protein